MMTDQFKPDPSDISNSTIQQLFYRQIRSLTLRTRNPSVNDKMKTFDLQVSDAWF